MAAPFPAQIYPICRPRSKYRLDGLQESIGGTPMVIFCKARTGGPL